MLEGLSAGHTQKKALSCLCRSKKLFKWKFFFFFETSERHAGAGLDFTFICPSAESLVDGC